MVHGCKACVEIVDGESALWDAAADIENAEEIAIRDRLCVASLLIAIAGAFATLFGVFGLPFLCALALFTTPIVGAIAALFGVFVVPSFCVLAPECWFVSCLLGCLASRRIGLCRYRFPARKLVYTGILL